MPLLTDWKRWKWKFGHPIIWTKDVTKLRIWNLQNLWTPISLTVGKQWKWFGQLFTWSPNDLNLWYIYQWQFENSESESDLVNCQLYHLITNDMNLWCLCQWQLENIESESDWDWTNESESDLVNCVTWSPNDLNLWCLWQF